MGINWEMGVSNPMQGINSGLASLGQALQQQKQQDRQAKLDAMSMDLHGLEAQKSRLTLADLQRKYAQNAELRKLQANPQTIPGTPGVSNISQPSPGIQGLSGLAAMGGADFTGRGAAPAPTMEDPTQGAASPAGFSLEQAQPTAGPQVGATNEGVTPGTEARQESPEKLAYNFYRANDPAKALEYRKEVLAQARELAQNGDHKGSVELAKAVGANIEYLASKKDVMLLDHKDGTYSVYNPKDGSSIKIGEPTKANPEDLLDKRLAATAAENEKNRKAEAEKTDKQIAASDRKLASVVAAANNKTDPIVAREVVKDLPKLRREANTAVAAKSRLDQMIGLMDKGSAGGLKGTLLNTVSGIFDVPATSEADLFKKLASAGAGQLRSTVIGPGQVSNYEQKLLQSVSGGGSGARTAVRELLLFYKQEADRTIGNYNDAVESAASVAPSVSKGFKKIGGQAQPPGGSSSTPKPGTVQDGYRFKGGNPADPKSWVKVAK